MSHEHSLSGEVDPSSKRLSADLVEPPIRPRPYSAILRPVMPELDSIRGLAVLLVLFYHGFFWSNGSARGETAAMKVVILASRPGWLGVELFFVLSGFLITNILLGSRSRPDYYRRFYTRRAVRILPAYLALIVLLLAVRAIDWRFALVSTAFMANVSTYLGVPMQYGPLWSLAVEEHFYLLWPTAARRLGERWLALVAGILIVGEPVVRLVASRNGAGGDVYGPTWFMLDGLAFGSLLAIAIRWTGQDRRAVKLIVIGCAALALLMAGVGAPYGLATRTRLLGAALQTTAAYLLFVAVLGSALLIGSGPRRRLVDIAPLRFFGWISYGLYLIHLLVFGLFDRAATRWAPSFMVDPRPDWMILVRFVICAGASVAVAFLSRRTFEEYFLRRKDSADVQRRGERVDIARAPLDGVPDGAGTPVLRAPPAQGAPN